MLTVAKIGAALLVCCVVVATAPLHGKSSNTKTKKEALKWSPVDTDARLPAITPDPGCPLADATQRAGERAVELVANLEKFDAVESTQQAVLDHDGFPLTSDELELDYSVEFERTNGTFGVHESRTAMKGSSSRPQAIQDSGLAALAIVFHPIYQVDFDMQCEGSMDWEGKAAWVIHFRQKKGKPSRILSIRDGEGLYHVPLKGRAWLAKDSGQLIRLETNLAESIPTLRLVVNSISVNYAPVHFQSKDVDLWLPQRVEAFSDYTTRRFMARHLYSDFQLFSVDTQSVIEKPKLPAENPQKP
jgi:hypothetical protein